jgi:itaconate CoA-transferase
VPLLHHDYAGRATPRVGLSHAAIYPYGLFACRDGELVIVAQNASEWSRLCSTVLGRPDLVDDMRFRDNPSRLMNRDALDAEIKPAFARTTVAEAIGALEKAQLAWGKVSTVADLSRHPALRRTVSDVPGGSFELAAPPLHPDVTRAKVPSLGEHSDAIRREFAALAVSS